VSEQLGQDQRPLGFGTFGRQVGREVTTATRCARL